MDVELDIDGRLAILRLNRPSKLNAITPTMLPLIADGLDRVERDRGIGALMLTGSGRGFCAGADIGGGEGGYPAPQGPADVRDEMRDLNTIVRRLHRLEKPVVAAVRGPAVGIGWTLALACDMIIASVTARFCAIFLNRALVPECGTIALLAAQVGHFRAREIVYTGRFVEAPEAAAIGLVNEVVADDLLEEHTRGVARRLSQAPGFALALTKQMFNDRVGLDAAFAAELLAAPAAFCADDRAEAVAALGAKRQPEFTGR